MQWAPIKCPAYREERPTELAATAETPELRALLLELAAKWQALAVEAERVHAMLAKTRTAQPKG
jgi:hypothetical protein